MKVLNMKWSYIVLVIICSLSAQATNNNGSNGVGEVSNLATTPVIREDNPDYDNHIVMWLEKYGRQIQLTRDMPDCELLFVGDSITEHWPLNDYAPQIWQKYYSHRKVINVGSGGDKTENILWRLENGIFNKISPKLIILMAGTNNTGRGDSPKEILKGIDALIKSINRLSPNSIILLHAIFPRGKDSLDSKRRNNKVVNLKLKQLANNYTFVDFVNINDKFLTKNGLLDKSIMPDLLHPNAKGYQIWAEAIEDKVQFYLKE